MHNDSFKNNTALNQNESYSELITQVEMQTDSTFTSISRSKGLLELLNEAFNIFQEQTAIELNNKQISYNTLDIMANNLANCLIANQLSKGSLIAVILDDKVKENDLERGFIPIGKPIKGAKALVLDLHGNICPHGIFGELYIRTPYRTLGYYNRSELTKEVFLPNPFSDDPNDLIYKTGDLARVLNDGNFQLRGRKDHQVKIRGIRVELGEIEHQLRGHNLIKDAVVLIREDIPGEKRLVAYLVLKQMYTSTINEIRYFLKQKLPDYMIPSFFVLLEALPLTPNGKVNHHALPAPDQSRPEQPATFVSARTPIQQQITDIWSQVLRFKQVGIYDNFFELGGDSLLATQVISRVCKYLHVNLSPRTLFEDPTIANLSIRVELASRAEKRSLQAVSITPISHDGNLLLSFAQQRLWFLEQLAPGRSDYNMSKALRLIGLLNVAALEQSLCEILRRHEILRTTFLSVNGEPRQVISPNIALTLPVVDIRKLSSDQREAEVLRQAIEEAQQPFDLSKGELLRVKLLCLTQDSYVLLITMHHIVCDGWSYGVFFREMAALYEAFSTGKLSPLLETSIQYADFIYWQRNWLQTQVLESQLSYWKQQLGKNLPVLQLPTDYPRPSVQTYHGASQILVLNKALTEAVKVLSQRLDVTLFMTLLALFQTLLFHYSRQTDIIVGTPIANRNQVETEEIIGFFANTLVMRTDFSGNPTFLQLLGRVHEVALGAYAHQDLPFEKLVEELQPERNLSCNPLFQVMFILHNVPERELKLPDLTITPLQIESVTAKFDLTLSITETEQGLIEEWEYNTDLFDVATIIQMAEHFQTCLEAIVANPEQRVSEFLLPIAIGQYQLQEQWNNIQAEYLQKNCIPLLLSKIKAIILDKPFIDDCVVLVQEAETLGQELVAYVVLSKPLTLKQLKTHLQAILPCFWLPITYVPVFTLPLTLEGHIDEQALTHLEVIDDDLIQRWEKSLRLLPEIEQLAVIVHEQTESFLPLHLSDVLPNWKATDEFVLEESVADHQAVEQNDLEPEIWAICDGGSLTIEEDSPKTLTDALLQTAIKFKNKGIFFIQSDGSEVFQTYASLLLEAKCILNGLSQMGLKAGDKVILQIEELRYFFPPFWACILGGIIPVTIAVAPTYTQKNSVLSKLFNTWELLNYPTILTTDSLIESLCGLKSFLVMEDLKVLSVDKLRNYSPAVQIYQSHPHQVAFFQLTSGSTGVPKCIQETHSGIVYHIHSSKKVNNYYSEDVSLNWLPMDHVVPLLMYHIKDVYLGCQQIQVPTNVILTDPLKWLYFIEKYRVTHTWSPNFGYKLISDSLLKVHEKIWDLSSIKRFVNAGEQVTLSVIRDFLRLVARYNVNISAMQPAFGMAELCTCITYQNDFGFETGVNQFLKSTLSSKLQKVNTNNTNTISFVDLGPPIPGVQIRIVNKDNQLLLEGVIGRVQIKGNVVTPGYFNNNAANQEAFLEDGWFNTGDLGFLLNSHLTITGREKEIIVIHGVNYYCYEVEDIVNEINGIEPTYVAAFGIDDLNNVTENLVVFFTPLVEEIEKKIDLIKAIKIKVASNLGINPIYVIPVAKSEFPKTTSGKIQRAKLKNLLLSGYFQNDLKEIDIYSKNNNTLPDWFYQKIWRRKEAVSSCEQLPASQYLVFLDQLGLGKLVCSQLDQLKQSCVRVEAGSDFVKLSTNHYYIHPNNPDHYRQLLKSLSEDGIEVNQILHLWTYDKLKEEVSSQQMLEQAQELGVYSLLFLIQALDQGKKVKKQVRLLVVSSYTQQVKLNDEIAYEKTPILGLMKTIPQEMLWLNCHHLDLALESVYINAIYIFREMQTVKGDREIAYRQGQRLIPRLEKVDLCQEFKQELPFRPGGMYLISGGLGGIGVEIAQYLLKNYQAQLLLIGRTSLPERNEWDFHLEKKDSVSKRINTYLMLERMGGNICYEAVDICDNVRLQKIVDQAQSCWQCRLDGVIHLAGVFQERLLLEETRESLAETLRVKVIGTWTLHQLVKDRANTIFISSSSVNSFFGGAMVGAYTAANSFLESFSNYQRQKYLLRSYCFSWSMWDEVGMSQGYLMKDMSRARGYQPITAAQGLHSLIIALHHQLTQVLVGLDGSNKYIRQYTETKLYPVQKLFAYFTSQSDYFFLDKLQKLVVLDRFKTQSSCGFLPIEEMPLTEKGEIDREQLINIKCGFLKENSECVPAQNELELQLLKIWEKVLGIEPISIRDNFFKLGGNSLLAIRLVAQIEKVFMKNLPLATFFQNPTIEQLAKILCQSELSEPFSYLVPIQPNGSKIPLFLCQGVSLYQPLISCLGLEQPIYGLIAEDRQGRPVYLNSIEELASHYIKEIKIVQPTGPYLIGGLSFGGVIAFEVAQQLLLQGDKVALLALFDSHLPEAQKVLMSIKQKLLYRLNDHLNQLFKIGPMYFLDRLKWRLKIIYGKIALKNELFRIERFKHIVRREAYFQGIKSYSKNYVPKVYPGRVILFEAGDRLNTKTVQVEPGLGWNKLVTGELEIYKIPGDHLGILKEPNVQLLAKKLKFAIDEDLNNTKANQ